MLATNMNAPSAGYGGYVGMGAPVGMFGGGYVGMGAPVGMFGGSMGGMASMGGLGGIGGVYGGTSTPMASMGGMEAPSGGFVASMGSSLLLQVMVAMKKKQKMEMKMTLIMWLSDDVFAFVICKFVLNFIMWILNYAICVCLLNYVMNLNYARSFIDDLFRYFDLVDCIFLCVCCLRRRIAL
jgi:hypothetical protein